MKNPRAFFEDNLQLIDGISSAVCRRNGCRGPDAEDFASVVRLKLLENDCARLQQFQGRSKVSTFLTFVITNLFRDYRNHLWGKWRSSMAAQRLGQEAMLLERLTTRDERSIDEAIEILVRNYKVEMPREELWALWRQLPEKSKRRFVAVEEAPEIVAESNAGSRAEASEAEGFRRRLVLAFREAFEGLPEEDRLLLRLCFEGALSVAKIARSLGKNQRQLYYRREAACLQLRKALEAGGVNAHAAMESIGWDGWQSDESKIIFESVYEERVAMPRQEESEVDRSDPSRLGSPRGLRRRQAARGREAAGRSASSHL